MITKKEIAFEIIQDLFVSSTLTCTALLVSKAGFVPVVILKEICFAWIVNLIIGFTVPEGKIGQKLAEKLNLKGIPFFLIMMLVIVTINVIGISLCVVLKNVGLKKQFFDVWLGLFPVLMVVGYIAALVWFPLTGRITSVIFRNKD